MSDNFTDFSKGKLSYVGGLNPDIEVTITVNGCKRTVVMPKDEALKLFESEQEAIVYLKDNQA